METTSPKLDFQLENYDFVCRFPWNAFFTIDCNTFYLRKPLNSLFQMGYVSLLVFFRSFFFVWWKIMITFTLRATEYFAIYLFFLFTHTHTPNFELWLIIKRNIYFFLIFPFQTDDRTQYNIKALHQRMSPDQLNHTDKERLGLSTTLTLFHTLYI